MNKLEVKHVFKRFKDKEVLKNISFSIKEGECFGLIGPNGAGKSTLIDIIVGLLPENSGEVLIDGKNIKSDIENIRKHLGYVPQDLALIEHLSGRRNIEYFGNLYGLDKKNINNKIDELALAFDIKDDLDKKVSGLSGGMKRKINLMASLIHSPNFLILDEPTVGIDPKSRNDIYTYLRKLIDEGTTILYTTHYIEEVENLCNRIFILEKGEKIAYGTKSDIQNMVSSNVKWSMEISETQSINIIDLLNELKRENIGIVNILNNKNKIDLVVDPEKFSTNKLFLFLNKHNIELLSIMRNDLTLEESFLQLTSKTVMGD